MKTIAYIFNNFNSPIITIEEACRRKKSLADKWENWTYYDLVKLRPMSATCRLEKASSYTYQKDKDKTKHGKGSKGLAHELVQQYICNLEEDWAFKIYGKEIILKIKSIEDEFHIIDPETNQNRFIDCMIHLHPECNYYEKFQGKLGIEVTDTSSTSNRKKNTFERLGINVIELKMIKDWHIPNKTNYEKEDIIKLRGRIKGFLNKKPSLGKLYIKEFI